jgi:hypothetical protein
MKGATPCSRRLHVLRAMNAWVDHKEEAAKGLSGLRRPLVAPDMAMVFYDMTTTRGDGLWQQEEDCATSACPKKA